MLRFPRPDEPAGFAARVEAARRAVEDKLEAGESLSSDDFDSEPWRRYKEHLIAAQHGKCGYCEADIAGNDYGGVDHYAPKASYPRLAYVWENWVYACDFCNSTHKRAQFPTMPASPDTDWRGVVELDPGEVALLLNPYEHETDPADHLEYGREGQIQPRAGSDRGWHTIDVCKLDREWLRAKRARVADNVYRWIMELEDAVKRNAPGDMDRVLEVIGRAGAAREPFAGMVRAMFQHMTGRAWDATFPEPV